MASKKIKVSKDGPYLVSGGIPLAEQVIVSDSVGVPHCWREEKKLPAMESYALCRCGQSKKKPFCDGAHVKAGFDGSETAGRKPYIEEAQKTEGPALDLTDVPALCAGAGFCQRAGGTWALVSRSNDPEARKTAIQEAHDCPAGRLVAWDKQGNAIEPKFEPSIGLVRDPNESEPGPLWVRGDIPVESGDGTTYEVRRQVTLCRCGKSKNKPFCDASHQV